MSDRERSDPIRELAQVLDEGTLRRDSIIHELAGRVADGTATKDQARKLLTEFVRGYEHGTLPRERLIAHVARCFAVYLNGERRLDPVQGAKSVRNVAVLTLDQAFGLVRKGRGQPPIDREIRCQVAMSVLIGRIAGRSLESVAQMVAEHRSRNDLPLSTETQVRAAWAACKRDAIESLQARREIAEVAWTEAEVRCLRKIYHDVSGVVLTSKILSKVRRAAPKKSRNTKA
jgi:hypothetical protein